MVYHVSNQLVCSHPTDSSLLIKMGLKSTFNPLREFRVWSSLYPQYHSAVREMNESKVFVMSNLQQLGYRPSATRLSDLPQFVSSENSLKPSTTLFFEFFLPRWVEAISKVSVLDPACVSNEFSVADCYSTVMSRVESSGASDRSAMRLVLEFIDSCFSSAQGIFDREGLGFFVVAHSDPHIGNVLVPQAGIDSSEPFILVDFESSKIASVEFDYATVILSSFDYFDVVLSPEEVLSATRPYLPPIFADSFSVERLRAFLLLKIATWLSWSLVSQSMTDQQVLVKFSRFCQLLTRLGITYEH